MRKVNGVSKALGLPGNLIPLNCILLQAGKTRLPFDWAAKRMLRDKANFGVFEGLITVLLNEPVHIIEILENESNQIEGDIPQL